MMRIIITITFLLILSCKTKTKTTQTDQQKQVLFTPQFTPGPQALIYKTKADYTNLVPVILSEDKTSIISYPDPKDIVIGGVYQIPTSLKDGYLIDNRGIGKNVAFLKLTYEEYSKLTEVPSLSKLMELIVDKDPLIELCDCGNKNAFTDIKGQLNGLIDSSALRINCKVVK